MKFSLAMPCEALSIPVIRRVLGDALRGLGVAEHCVTDILVAVSEACTNVVQHSESTTQFEIVAVIEGDGCVLKIMDRGRGLRERGSRSAGGAGYADADAESGRGIAIMRALVDNVTFDTVPGPSGRIGTAVYLQKRLTWDDEALIRRLERELVHSAR
jgi:serine/threonine-protein kinase RsbW